MTEQKFDNLKSYDNPIPKPPDELFYDFLRNTEARLVTKRFDTSPRRSIKQVNEKSN